MGDVGKKEEKESGLEKIIKEEVKQAILETAKKYEELGEQYKKLLDDYLDLKNNQIKRNKLIRKLVRENEELNLLLQVKLGRYLNKIKKARNE